jgi:hypothetical protein
MSTLYQKSPGMSSIKIFSKILLVSAIFLVFPPPAGSAEILNYRLKGKILIQAESRGEAWYVYPGDLKRYSLGRPDDAFAVMKKLASGISNANLEKIAVGIIENNTSLDTDKDGLNDGLEDAIGTDKNKNDTDGDGYSDKTEAADGFNPNGSGRKKIDLDFSKKYSGMIFLQTEGRGEAWYLNPSNLKRYYLGRPNDVLAILIKFGLGITNADLEKIAASKTAANAGTAEVSSGENIIGLAARTIRERDESASSYFIPAMKERIQYAFENMSKESLLLLGNILSGSSIKSKNSEEIIYKNDVYFSLGGYEVPLEFKVKKQPDGKWLLMNL